MPATSKRAWPTANSPLQPTSTAPPMLQARTLRVRLPRLSGQTVSRTELSHRESTAMTAANVREEMHAGVWESLGSVVAPAGGVLPQRCVKCNEPASEPVKFEFSYIPWQLELTSAMLPSVIGTFVGSSNMTSAQITGYLCGRHARRWRNLRKLSTVMMLAWLIPAAACAVTDFRFEELAFSTAVILIPVGYVIRRTSYPVEAKLIRDGYVWIKGCGQAFIRRCAPLPPAGLARISSGRGRAGGCPGRR